MCSALNPIRFVVRDTVHAARDHGTLINTDTFKSIQVDVLQCAG